VVSLQLRDVVGRVVEVDGVPALAPPEHRDVVDPALADRDREQVGALQGEVGGVVGAEARAREEDLRRAAAVRVDERHDLLEDPALVSAVAAGALLHRQRLVVPCLPVDRVDAVELDPARIEQPGHGVHHAHALVVVAVALLGGEREHGPPIVAVRHDAERRPERFAVQADVALVHLTT